VHALVRSQIPFVEEDRSLHPEIESLGERIVAGDVAAAAASLVDGLNERCCRP
jgi:hypothetical protein